VQACFEQAGATTAPSSQPEVVPQAGGKVAIGTHYSPHGDTFAVVGGSLALFSSTGLQLGSIDSAELGASLSAPMKVAYSADGKLLLVWTEGYADTAADRPALVLSSKTATVVRRCSVKTQGYGLF
jgi:hypothetical protein